MPRASARVVVTSPPTDSGVTITTPAHLALVNSTNVNVAWAFNTTQAQYRIQFYSDPDGENIIADTQWTASGTQAATVAVPSMVSNSLYYVRVFAVGTLNEESESAIRTFYFALPASVTIAGLIAEAWPNCAPGPLDNPAIRVSWTRPALTETFLAYEVRRRKRGETTYVAIARIFALEQSWYYDSNTQPGEEYEYVVVYYGDTLTPETKVSTVQATPARAIVTFDFIYIHEVDAAQTEFTRVDSFGGSVQPKMDITIAETWGRQRPSAFVGEAFSYTLQLPGLDKIRRHPAEWRKFIRMFERQSTVGTTLCVRYGLDRELYFVSMLNLSKSLSQLTWAESIDLQEVYFNEDIGLYVHTAGDSA